MPIGKKDKVCFNAHRVFNPNTIIQTLQPLGLEITEFSYIDGFNTRVCLQKIANDIVINQANVDLIPEFQNWGTTGLFAFTKVL